MIIAKQLHNQYGHMDMQFTPAIIGVVLLYVLLGMLDSPDLDAGRNLLVLCFFLFLATVVLLFGFVMHLYALGYPESPFNRHSSPVFMTLLCAGPLVYGAYKFYTLTMWPGIIVSALLALLVVAASIGFAIRRNRHGRPA